MTAPQEVIDARMYAVVLGQVEEALKGLRSAPLGQLARKTDDIISYVERMHELAEREVASLAAAASALREATE